MQWSANPQVSAAILKNQKDIGEETLATNFENVPEKNETANELGLWLELTKNS